MLVYDLTVDALHLNEVTTDINVNLKLQYCSCSFVRSLVERGLYSARDIATPLHLITY